MEPPPIQVPLIATDILCVKCHYNLRTRPRDGVCPECGQPIPASVKHHLMYAGAILEPATLRLAAYCFAAPALLSLVVCVGLYLFRLYEHTGTLTQTDLILEYLAHVLFLAALLLGVFLLGGSVTRIVADPAKRMTLSLLVAVYGAINVFLCMTAVTTLLFGRPGPFRVWVAQTGMQELRLGTALMCLILALAGMPIMRSLAQALASARLESLTRWAFGVMIADAAATLAILLVTGAMIPRRDPSRFAALFTALDLASAAIYTGFGWYWLIVAKTVKQRTSGAADEMMASAPASTAGAQEKVAAFLSHRGGKG